MKKITKKLVAGLFVVSLFLATPVLAASRPSTPKIGKISKVGKNSIILPITDSEFSGKKIKVKVFYTNRNSEKSKNFSRVIKLNSEGKGDIKVNKLDSNTKYSFKLQLKEDFSKSKYSKISKSVTKKTKN